MAVTKDTGITQYLKYGTGADADTYCGRVTGGELRADARRIWRPSVGGAHGVGRGILDIGGTATIEVAEATLLNYFQRASYTNPSLSALVIEGGLYGQNKSFKQTGCYLGTLDFDFAVGDALTATIGWQAVDQAISTAGSAPAQAGTHWEWFQGACLFNGTAYKLQRLRFSASNNLEPISDIETKASNYWLPTDIKIGKLTCEVNLDMIQVPGTTAWDLAADTDVTDLVAVMSATDGSNTITITVSNLAGSTTRVPLEGDDSLVVVSMSLSAEPNATDTLAIAYT